MAESLKLMGLRHVVITCVDRDDLSDGGAAIWAETINRVHEACPNMSVEALVGDFNNWSIMEHPLQRNSDGSWTTAVTLESGRDYQYRYFANGVDWHNDWKADAYVTNEYGTDNSVVSTKAEAMPAAKTAKKPSSRKKAA